MSENEPIAILLLKRYKGQKRENVVPGKTYVGMAMAEKAAKLASTGLYTVTATPVYRKPPSFNVTTVTHDEYGMPTDEGLAFAAREALGLHLAWPDGGRDGPRPVDNAQAVSWLQGVPQRLNPYREWRCFHCDDVFTDRAAAAAHFGVDQSQTPACQIAASEGGLLRALRQAEAAAVEAHQMAHDESTDAIKAWRGALSRFDQQVRQAEETGYARGVADARAEAAGA